jgi:hypothetical protein
MQHWADPDGRVVERLDLQPLDFCVPLRTWVFVCYVCWVCCADSGLCDELITRSEESYRARV